VNMTEQRLSGPEEEILRAQIIAGSCILFIGPDISRKLFNRSGLTRQLAVCHGWGSTDASSFPWLAQCYELEHGRAALLSFIRKKIRKEPPACYRTIAALPFRLILTTNYDTLLEEAFDEQGVVYQKIIGDYDLKHGMLDRVRIVKLYGCITEPDSMVITEEDQFAFLDRWPNIIDVLGRGFSNKTLLFIGCDLAQRRRVSGAGSGPIHRDRTDSSGQPGLHRDLYAVGPAEESVGESVPRGGRDGRV